MSNYIFQGLYSPPEEENVRVQVLVLDLNYFLSNPAGTVFAQARVNGEWEELGEIERQYIIFDACGPERGFEDL